MYSKRVCFTRPRWVWLHCYVNGKNPLLQCYCCMKLLHYVSIPINYPWSTKFVWYEKRNDRKTKFWNILTHSGCYSANQNRNMMSWHPVLLWKWKGLVKSLGMSSSGQSKVSPRPPDRPPPPLRMQRPVLNQPRPPLPSSNHQKIIRPDPPPPANTLPPPPRRLLTGVPIGSIRF